MKKMFVCIVAFLSMFLMVGCTQKREIKESFSEITYAYFCGVSLDEKMTASISVGKREEPYIIDGKHGKNCDFSLLIVKFDFYVEENEISVDFYSNNIKDVIILEYNPLNSTFMVDLGYALENENVYSLGYQNYILEFKNESEGFKVDYNLAIKKSLETLGEKILSYYRGNNFEGECYLKIFSKLEDGKQNLYWIFTVVGENQKSNNVVIDIQQDKVILSN